MGTKALLTLSKVFGVMKASEVSNQCVIFDDSVIFYYECLQSWNISATVEPASFLFMSIL